MTTEKFNIEQGDLFDYAETHVIGHGVNVKGVMGGGIAAQFAQHYPEMKAFYQTVCASGTLVPGGILPWSTQYDYEVVHHIANVASQCYPGADAQLNWLYQSLVLAASYANSVERPLAICEIGCDIGGLDRIDAYKVFSRVAVYVDHGLTVVKYAPKPKPPAGVTIDDSPETIQRTLIDFGVYPPKRSLQQTYTGIYAPGTK